MKGTVKALTESLLYYSVGLTSVWSSVYLFHGRLLHWLKKKDYFCDWHYFEAMGGSAF